MTAPQTEIGHDVSRAAELLRSSQLVAFATETVYGLGGLALDSDAVAAIFAAKNRPHFDPLIVHVAEPNGIEPLVQSVSGLASELMSRFWPGPLTLVLPKTDIVPDLVTSGLPHVAVRCPGHPLAAELLRLVDAPVAAPSANPFGAISPTTAQHVADQLDGKIPYVLDGGPCRVGLESTVVRIDDDSLVLLRPGGVTSEELRTVTENIIFPEAASDDDTPQVAPGMLSRHYAPRTPLYIMEAPVPSMSQRVGLLSLLPLGSCQPFAAKEVLSETGNLTEAAANFFAAMRRLDEAGLDCILATPFPEEGLGIALNNRLRRAAEPD